jgi:hypothetical protein
MSAASTPGKTWFLHMETRGIYNISGLVPYGIYFWRGVSLFTERRGIHTGTGTTWKEVTLCQEIWHLFMERREIFAWRDLASILEEAWHLYL